MTTPKDTEAQPEQNVAVVKATVAGGATERRDLLEALTAPAGEKLPQGALEPPYDFQTLYDLFEFSSILRPCIDAYVTNIDSFGHHAIPSVDLTTEEAAKQIGDAMYYERAEADGALLSDDVGDEIAVEEPTEDEVEDYLKRIRRRARLEFVRQRAFFDHCVPGSSFVKLRRKTRQDLEVLGNTWWEITRNKLGEIVHLHYVTPLKMRLHARDEEYTAYTIKERVTDIKWRDVEHHKRFRRHLKLQDKADPIYFKEFGDPRVVSRNTGKAYEDLEELQAEEEGALPATELVHFRIESPTSAYGVPRWVATAPSVLGSRELDEVNLNYFKNNTVPPLALLCAGGRFGSGVATKIEEFIDEHLKGRKGIHRILVLEAQSQRSATGDTARTTPKLQFVPLRDVQQTDALFQNYDQQNEAKVARSFRLPRMLRGDDSQVNKATAWASLRFAEEQVFEPEREDFDDWINRTLLPALSILFWVFRSNAPVTRDPERMSIMVCDLVKAGILLPKEGRELLQDIFNRTFIEIQEDWTRRPLPLTLAQMGSALPETSGGDQPEDQHRDQTTSPLEPSARSSNHDNRRPEPLQNRAGTPLAPLAAHKPGSPGE